MTIFRADFAADCFRVTPRNAPSKKSNRTPMTIVAVTAYVSGNRTRGKSRNKDARADVLAGTIPAPNALRLIFPNNRRLFGCSVVRGAGLFLLPLVCRRLLRFVNHITS